MVYIVLFFSRCWGVFFFEMCLLLEVDDNIPNVGGKVHLHLDHIRHDGIDFCVHIVPTSQLMLFLYFPHGNRETCT